MQAEEFVRAVRKEVIDISWYKDIFKSTEVATDPTWKDFLPIYRSLDEHQKLAVEKFIRMVQVNTASGIFGILDGSSYLSEEREDFRLITASDGQQINGDLQDIFLEMEEEEE